jgi:adenylosuccinate lyase
LRSVPLSALSPLDGRYATKVDALRRSLSEFGLIRSRVRVEVEWLIALGESGLPGMPVLDSGDVAVLRALSERFGEADAEAVKQIEGGTNHDVKAVELWLADRAAALLPGAANVRNAVHFACTSEDINNTSHGLMLNEAREKAILPAVDRLVAQMVGLAGETADVAMMARTHGQPATPTTLGKEVANVAARLVRARQGIAAVRLTAKMNGAVGNYNAHVAAYPEVDWAAFARRVVEERLGLVFNAMTTQIEPHDTIAELFDAVKRLNVVALDWARDVWGYISLGTFTQKAVAGEVGSSTMPHKVNPIDFENAEGNLGVANALLVHLAEKLPVSRFQRDLTDSTALRNMGPAFGHTLLALDALSRGMAKLGVGHAAIARDLEGAWELLAEPLQTVLRAHGIDDPYGQLKALTRGKAITRDGLQAFVRRLAIPDDEKERLLALTPEGYVGRAAELTREFIASQEAGRS